MKIVKEFKPLKCFLKWSYGEPKHPKESMTEFTWGSGINITIAGPELKFDENTTLSEWRQSEIKKWENLMEDFNKGKRIQQLDFRINPNRNDVEEVESDINFIKWVD
jgi:hypothetical protein